MIYIVWNSNANSVYAILHCICMTCCANVSMDVLDKYWPLHQFPSLIQLLRYTYFLCQDPDEQMTSGGSRNDKV